MTAFLSRISQVRESQRRVRWNETKSRPELIFLSERTGFTPEEILHILRPGTPSYAHEFLNENGENVEYQRPAALDDLLDVSDRIVVLRDLVREHSIKF